MGPHRPEDIRYMGATLRFPVPGDHHAAFSGDDEMSSVKREAGHVAPVAHHPPFIGSPVCLAGIFYHSQVV